MNNTIKKISVGIVVFVSLVVYGFAVRNEQPTVTMRSSSTHKTNTTGSSSGSASGNGSGSASSTSSSQSQSGTTTTTASYKDGSYTGSVENAYYGDVQVKATISGGKITDVTFLQHPDTHSTSVRINEQAMPYLQQEAIQAQSAQVDTVSGATYTSQAFMQSLSNALSQAS